MIRVEARFPRSPALPIECTSGRAINGRCENEKEMSPILVFVVASYRLSIALRLVIGFTGGHESVLIALAYLSMFLPAAALVFVSATRNEPPRIHWAWFP